MKNCFLIAFEIKREGDFFSILKFKSCLKKNISVNKHLVDSLLDFVKVKLLNHTVNIEY